MSVVLERSGEVRQIEGGESGLEDMSAACDVDDGRKKAEREMERRSGVWQSVRRAKPITGVMDIRCQCTHHATDISKLLIAKYHNAVFGIIQHSPGMSHLSYSH